MNRRVFLGVIALAIAPKVKPRCDLISEGYRTLARGAILRRRPQISNDELTRYVNAVVNSRRHELAQDAARRAIQAARG